VFVNLLGTVTCVVYDLQCNCLTLRLFVCRSYKEQSEGSTDEEDVIDASEPADDAASQEESDAETIEKVIRHRIGRKGGVCVCVYCCLTHPFYRRTVSILGL